VILYQGLRGRSLVWVRLPTLSGSLSEGVRGKSRKPSQSGSPLKGGRRTTNSLWGTGVSAGGWRRGGETIRGKNGTGKKI